MTLRPAETETKILISSSCHFYGEYEKNDLLLTHAWPFAAPAAFHFAEQSPWSRGFFMLALELPARDPNSSIKLPDYSPYGDFVCALLAILFGKRFDNHGRTVGIGLFMLPNMSTASEARTPGFPFNNNAVRPDFKIEHNLTQFGRLAPLFESDLDPKFENILSSAARFYLRAIQEAERHPEIAYVDLITCGEILANFFEYEPELLMDADLLKDLSIIEKEVDGGRKIVKRIRQRLYQVKKRFVLTLMRLLSPAFFDRTEALHDFGSLKRDRASQAIGAAYDLRSQYVHTGISFGGWVMHSGFEIQIGEPVLENKNLRKTLVKAPTFFGLERIMRYCLLRFIHLHGFTLDESLNGEGLECMPSADAKSESSASG